MKAMEYVWIFNIFLSVSLRIRVGSAVCVLFCLHSNLVSENLWIA